MALAFLYSRYNGYNRISLLRIKYYLFFHVDYKRRKTLQKDIIATLSDLKSQIFMTRFKQQLLYKAISMSEYVSNPLTTIAFCGKNLV